MTQTARLGTYSFARQDLDQLGLKPAFALLQVWQQQFAWTEAGRDAKLVARAAALPPADRLAQEPLFCVETMMHLLYFSCLIYDYKRVRQYHVP